MPTYMITAPDGRKFRVSGPGSQEEALAEAQATYQPSATSEQPESQPRDAPYPSLYDQGDEAGKAALRVGKEAARVVGRTGMAAAQGGSALLQIPANALAGLVDLALEKAGVDFRFGSQGEALRGVLDPEDKLSPQTATERVVDVIGESVAGAGVGIKAGQVLAGAADDVVAGVGRTLAANPVIQGVSATTGPIASEIARDSGAGTVGQTVAGLAGAFAPAVAASGAQSAVRGTFRGGEAGRQKVAENIDTFRKVGTEPSVGQATESRLAQGAESFLTRTPGGAGVMVRRAQTQAEEIAAGIEKRAAQLVKKTTGEQAGRQIQRSVQGEGGFIDRFKAQQEKLYDELDSFFPAQRRVQVEETRKALKELNQDIEGAENLSQWFKNARIKGIEEAFKKDTAPPAIDVSSPQAALQSAKTVKELDTIAERLKIGMAAEPTAEQAALENSYFSLRDALAAGKEAGADLASDIGRLPYEAVKKLRTLVGREMADAGLASDVPRSKWKALYAALSADLGKAVEGNPAAKAKWTRANNFTRAGMRRIESIESVIDKNGGPELIFRAATSNTKEGATTLRAVMQSVDQDGRKMISATVLRRLGRANPSNQNDTSGIFSTEKFLTGWADLSEEAKRTLFNRYGPTYRSDIDKIAKVAANLREGSKVFRNPSGTEQATAQAATVGGLAAALITAQFGAAALIAGGVAGSNLTARLMTNPRFVRWLAQSTRFPVGAYAGQVNRLAQLARQHQDEDMALAAAALENQQPEQQQKNNRSQNNR